MEERHTKHPNCAKMVSVDWGHVAHMPFWGVANCRVQGRPHGEPRSRVDIIESASWVTDRIDSTVYCGRRLSLEIWANGVGPHIFSDSAPAFYVAS